MKKTLILFGLLIILIPLSFAQIDKFKVTNLAGGTIRLEFTIENTTYLHSFSLLRASFVIKQGSISSNPYSDLFDDSETKNGETYSYTLKIFDKDAKLTQEKKLSVKADSAYPIILTGRKILSKSNVFTIKTDENSFCKAGVSPSNMVAMDGRGEIHSLKMGLVDGLNLIYLICEDLSGNLMPTTKILEYTYDSKAPGQIKSASALNHRAGQVLLSWDAAVDANKIKEYRIYKKEINSQKVDFIAVTNFTSYVNFKNLREGQTYSYFVSAVDKADNEGIKSKPINITIYNSDVFLETNKSISTKKDSFVINGQTIPNAQIVATLNSKIVETNADNQGYFNLVMTAQKSGTLFLESLDENYNSKLQKISVTKLPPKLEVEREVQIIESKPNIIFLLIVILVFLIVTFLIAYSTKKKNLDSELNSYLKKRRKKE